MRILARLAGSAGAPYFLLSATGLLLQTWYAALNRGALPYRLYALANAGSLIAPLSFPLVVEPMLRSSTQAYAWPGLYALFAMVCVGVAGRVATAVRSRERIKTNTRLRAGRLESLYY
ncbi:MAG: hypothetical protein ACR2NN_12775 [Bryobacteraceae bacterium]